MSRFLTTIVTLLGVGFALRRGIVQTVQVGNGTEDNPCDKLTIVVAIGNIGSQMYINTKHIIPDSEEEK